MSRNALIKSMVEKLAEEKKINSLVSTDRIDVWKIGKGPGELRIEWRAHFDTKFYAPKGAVLDRIIAGLKARPHV